MSEDHESYNWNTAGFAFLIELGKYKREEAKINYITLLRTELNQHVNKLAELTGLELEAICSTDNFRKIRSLDPTIQQKIDEANNEYCKKTNTADQRYQIYFNAIDKRVKHLQKILAESKKTV